MNSGAGTWSKGIAFMEESQILDLLWLLCVFLVIHQRHESRALHILIKALVWLTGLFFFSCLLGCKCVWSYGPCNLENAFKLANWSISMSFEKLEKCPVFNQGVVMLIIIYMDMYQCFILIMFCTLCCRIFFMKGKNT